MKTILFFLAPFIIIFLWLLLLYIITRPLVKKAQRKRLEREAKEEYEKMKLINEMINKDNNANNSYHE